jgi:Flp pilus assembly protein TadG
VRLCTIRHRLSREDGQAAVEFALVLPLLLLVLFAIVEFGRAYNAYNDLNQMAADGARFAAVARYPGSSQLLQSADTKQVQDNGSVLVTYAPNPCALGGTVRVQTTSAVTILPILGGQTLTLHGTAEMRVERCPA